ncbi:MAG TPA: cation:proton antiporter [Methylomirabilota bacterium]|nr:cation:proton antiporter [Methylomirabilota bacterium]
MATDHVFFGDLALVFVAAVLGGALARLARQPLILGYVLAGIAVSPFTPGPIVASVRTFELFAEIGVVLLMFSIGIEFSLRDLAGVKWAALIGAPVGIVLHVALGLAVGWALGWPPAQGAVIGVVTSVASTMVLVRLLMDRGELHARHGRILLGTVIVEDLAVVVLIMLISAMGPLEGSRVVAVAVAAGKALVVLVPFLWLAWRVVPHLMARAARTQSADLFLLVALAVGVGTAALTQAVGLSLALGAFLAGLLVNASDYAHETLDRLLPLRDVFVAFFFVTIGAVIDPRVLADNVPLLTAVVALVVAGKFLVRTALTRAFGFALPTAALVGVGLAQIGEFSFVMVQGARSAGLVGADVYNAVLAASLLSILLNALLMRATSAVAALEPVRVPHPVRGGLYGWDHLHGHVVLCGFGRVGSAVSEALETFRLTYVVIEIDPQVAQALRARGIACLLGDAARTRLLEAAGVARASLIVVAVPEDARALLAVRRIRALNPSATILARAHQRESSDALRRAGATEVIQPELEAGLTLIRHGLGALALPKESLIAYLECLRDAIGGGPERALAARQGLPRVREITLAADGFVDQPLREARLLERFGLTVVRIERADGDVVMTPDGETLLRAGDRIRVFGLPEQIDAFLAASHVEHDSA